MVLKNLLLQNKTTILKRWFDLILETYPADTAALMRKDQESIYQPGGYHLLSRDRHPFQTAL